LSLNGEERLVDVKQILHMCNMESEISSFQMLISKTSVCIGFLVAVSEENKPNYPK
jgi:hypothetical protein